MKYLKRLNKSEFIRNMFIVMSGSAVAQIIGFALTPIISRLFSPNDFGVYGAFSALASIIGAGVTLQFTQALMLPNNNEDALNLFVLSCLCTGIFGLLCLFCCILAPAKVNGLMKTDGNWALALLVISPTIAGIIESCQAWCVRVKAFKNTSAAQVIRSISSSAGQIGFGHVNGGAPGLIVSSILGDLFSGWNLARVVSRDLVLWGHKIRWEKMMLLAREYRDFPIYSGSMNIINTISLGLPILLLTHYYGLPIAGAFAFAMRILSTPMSFVLTALRQVLFQKAAEAYNAGDQLLPLFIKITIGLFALSIMPALLLFILAPQLFYWIFGSQWYVAGEFARSLVLWLLFMFCNLPAVIFARIIRIQRKLFYFDLLLLILRGSILIAGGMYLSAGFTIFLFSAVSACMNVVFIIIVGSILRRKLVEVNAN